MEPLIRIEKPLRYSQRIRGVIYSICLSDTDHDTPVNTHMSEVFETDDIYSKKQEIDNSVMERYLNTSPEFKFLIIRK
jgi:hypothetical protein